MLQTSRDDMFDVAIIGGGIACTHVLTCLLQNAKGSRSGLRVAVFEHTGEFWRGFPYGRRSSINSLIITPLCEFVPAGEREEFIAWLRANFENWRCKLLRDGGAVGRAWLDANSQAIQAGDWDEIYVPRWLYGDFVEERIEGKIAAAASARDVFVEKVTACVDDVLPSETGYILRFGDAHATIRARSVVLTIGSPPSLTLAGSQDLPTGSLYINNAYLPSLDENLQTLQRKLEAAPIDERNLLVVGSNATSLELIYMVSRRPQLRASVERLIVLSRSGAFPHRMTRHRFKRQQFKRLHALEQMANVAGPDILKATEADLQELTDAGVAVGDCLDHLNKLLVGLLERMTPAAEREFHVRYGMDFTRLVRRAGAEYRDPVDELAAAGKLDVIRAYFRRLSLADGDCVNVTYERDGVSTVSPIKFRAVFNCAGFESVSANSSSALLGNLVRSELVSANETGRGLKVDERFSAAPGFFVCGPLLAGVFNDRAKYWHIENVRRIQSIAEEMSSSIFEAVQLRHA